MTTHTFGSTGQAYDACQTNPDIKDGDTLVIPSEQVVGIAHTWPVAVTEKHGNLHTMKPGHPLTNVFTPEQIAAAMEAKAKMESAS